MRFDEAKLRTLRPVFSEAGTVTAANASSISDGGAALLLASERACAAQEPLPVGETFALRIQPAIDEKGGHQISAG